jgi:hypothetical protein
MWSAVKTNYFFRFSVVVYPEKMHKIGQKMSKKIDDVDLGQN